MPEGGDSEAGSQGTPPDEVAEIVLREERSILARQFEMMQHIDDRALRISRTSAVILGIVLTGVSLLAQPADGSAALRLPDIGGLGYLLSAGGIIGLVISIVLGIITTQYSKPVYGPGERVRHEIRGQDSTEKARGELSDEYDDAIDDMQDEIQQNRNLLWGVQISFILALILLVLGARLAFGSAISLA